MTSQKTRVAPHVSEDQVAVFSVLSEATRGDLDRVTEIWGDMINMLPVPEQAMLNVSRPIAASSNGLVVAFDFDVIRVNAMRKADLLQTMVTQIRELTQAQHERQLVFITTESWPVLRSKFVAQLPKHKKQTPAVNPDVEEEADTTEDNLVTEAKTIFDAGIVEEIDD